MSLEKPYCILAEILRIAATIMAIKINGQNQHLYEQILAIFLKVLEDEAQKIFPDYREKSRLEPSNINSTGTAIKPTPGQYRKGLEQGIHDMISWSKDLPKEIRLKIEQQLENQNLPSLSAMQLAAFNTIPKVLKRKSIRNETEWYLINEALSDTASELTPDQRTELDKYLHIFGSSR